jgi:hypothetical protein
MCSYTCELGGIYCLFLTTPFNQIEKLRVLYIHLPLGFHLLKQMCSATTISPVQEPMWLARIADNQKVCT